LWSDADGFRRAACRSDHPGAPDDAVSATCRQFLEGSLKARLQWNLEGQFAAFEAKAGR
jgi:adenosine deaminase